MSDLRDSLKKQRELERQYQDYSMEGDRLAAEERKELRRAKSNRKLTQAIGSAVDAIGKIGASKAGGLVSGDLVPELALGDFGASEIEDKYDTKRLEMTEKARKLRDEIADVRDERTIKQAEDVESRRETAKKEREERKPKAGKLKEEEEVLKYKNRARTKVDKLIPDTLIEDVELDKTDGKEAVEVLEDKGVPEEVIAVFRETVKPIFMNEDEELQAKTLTEMKQNLRLMFIRKRVKEDIEDGKQFSPVVLEALGIEVPELTPKAESAKIEKPAPEKAATPENVDELPVYKFKAPNGVMKTTGPLTPEQERKFLRGVANTPGMDAELIK